MTAIESYQRAHNQRALATAIRVAIDRVAVSRDLPKGADTLREMLEALRDVAQDLQIELDRLNRLADLDMDPAMGDPLAYPFGGKAGE
jgi:hypothetical protein